MTKPTVLIAEDDRDLSQLLWLNLRLAGSVELVVGGGLTSETVG